MRREDTTLLGGLLLGHVSSLLANVALAGDPVPVKIVVVVAIATALGTALVFWPRHST